MRLRAPIVVVACLALGVAACSSSSKTSDPTEATVIVTAPTTTTTTLPPAVLKPILDRMFAPNGSGAKLFQYLRLSASIATGAKPTIEQCKTVIKNLDHLATSDDMYHLAQAIPDPPLAKAFHDDIAVKRLLLASCEAGRLPANAPEAAHRIDAALMALLTQHGLRL